MSRNHGAKKLNLDRHSPAQIAAQIHQRIRTKADRNTTMVVVCPNRDVAYGPRRKGIVQRVLDDVDGDHWLVGEYVGTCLPQQIQHDLEEWLCRTN